MSFSVMLQSPLIIGQLINLYHQLFSILVPFILHLFILTQCCTCCSISILRNPLALMEFQQGSLKEVATEIAEPLTLLYNFSLQSGSIPRDWKRSNATAVYKHGPCEDPLNYRPISVVPIIAKVLEKLVASQLNGYCWDNQLFKSLSRGLS